MSKTSQAKTPNRARRIALRLEYLEPRILLSGTTAYTFQTLASFVGPNGIYPQAELVRDAAGNLYGTTDVGGANNSGTVFKVAAGSSTITTLASFDGTNAGIPKSSGVVRDSDGNLYGTTRMGGANNDGVVFELPAGSNTIAVLASFDGANGAYPLAGVIRDAGGNLYGTTENGGANDLGTVFELAAGSHTITTLASFNLNDGWHPEGGLITDGSGNLYGTTYEGGASSYGTVFELAAGSNTITTLASFDRAIGSVPMARLLRDGGGNLFGTTEYGGADNFGTIFKLAAGSNTITTLVSFTGANGSNPVSGLIMDGNGNLFGTTVTGGAHGYGTVFELAADGSTLMTLVSFDGAKGMNPSAGLMMDDAGNLYGTAYNGGANYDGTLFELSPIVGGTTMNLAGTWQMASEQAHGTLTADDSGGISSGSIQYANGSSATITGGSYAVDGQGKVTVSCDVSGGGTYNYVGGVNSAGDFATLTDAALASPDADFMTLVRNTGGFSKANLVGSWAFANAYVSGSLTFNGNGKVTAGNFSTQDGLAGSILAGGTYNVTADGLVTLTLFVPNANNPRTAQQIQLSGALNASKNVVVADQVPDSTSASAPPLLVLTKQTRGCAVSDLSGVWPLVSGGMDGSVIFNGAGKITGGGYTDADGTFSILSGTYTVAAGGQVTMRIVTNDPNAPPVATGVLNSSGDVLALDNGIRGSRYADNGFLSVLTNSSPADLVAQFGAVTIPNPAIPGDRGNVTVVVTNQGQVRALGTMTLNLHASTDQVGGGDIYLATLTNQPVNLAYNQSRAYIFPSAQLPLNLPPGQYYLRGDVNATQSIPEGDYTNNTAFTSTAQPMVYEFGAVGTRKGVVLQLTDADGTIARFALAGPGTGMVSVGASGWDLDVANSTASSIVVITTRKSTTPGDDGLIGLDGITVEGALAKFVAPTTNLTDSMTVSGKLSYLALDNLTGDGTITLGGAATDRTVLIFNHVQDESVTTGSTIALLQATSWNDADGDGTDSITAPGVVTAIMRNGAFAANMQIGAGGLGNLSVLGGSLTGNISAARIGVVTVTGGDLSGDLSSTATATDLGRLMGIGLLSVSGGDITGDVASNGNVGTIIATYNARTGHGGNASGEFNLNGALAGVTLVGGNLSGTLHVGGGLGSLAVNRLGVNGGNVTAGAGVTAGTIASLRVGGSMLGASGDEIAVNAGAITSLYVTGEMDYTALALSNPGRNMLLPALSSMWVGAWMNNSRLVSDGNVTSVLVGGMQNSALFAGVSNVADTNGDGVWDLPSAPADLSANHAGIGALTIRGMKTGTTTLDSFINSNIAGWKLGTMSLPYAPGSNNGVPFGVAGDQYTTLICWEATGRKIWRNSDPTAYLMGDGVVRLITT